MAEPTPIPVQRQEPMRLPLSLFITGQMLATAVLCGEWEDAQVHAKDYSAVVAERLPADAFVPSFDPMSDPDTWPDGVRPV